MEEGILKLEENRVRRMYLGGAGIEKIHGRRPVDSERPEEWIGSLVEAKNSEMPGIEKEGISETIRKGKPEYLDEVIGENPEYYLGKDHYEALGIQTGVLVKFLDSAIRLPLQAHPDRAYARKYLASPWGKMECYYILDVREGIDPYIYLGFQHAPARETWKRMVERQELEAMEGCFERIPVQKGEFWHIPAGMVHAIGQGITMVEIMEPSDWVIRCEFEPQKGRRFPYEARYMGKSIDEVMEIFDFQEYSPDKIRQKACRKPETVWADHRGKQLRMITEEETGCFRVDILELQKSQSLQKENRLMILLVLDGEGKLSCKQLQVNIKKGDSFFLAAAETEFEIAVSSQSPIKLCAVMPKAYCKQDNFE